MGVTTLAALLLTGVLVGESASALVVPVGFRSVGNTLYAGETLGSGESLQSSSGHFEATVRSGELVVTHRGVTTWSSGPALKGDVHLSLSSGALQLASANGNVIYRAQATGATRLTLTNSGTLELLSGTGSVVWRTENAASLGAAVKPHSFAPPVYNPSELYGGSNPAATCYTCEAAAATGVAPPSESLDAGTGVNTLSGDFSTSNTLFSAPAIGANLGVTLTYDAQLAQSELAGTAQTPTPTLGWGWSSNFSTSISPYGGSNGSLVVNLTSGAQVTFNQSPSFGTSYSCPSGDQTSTSKYTLQGQFQSTHQWCALANVTAQVADDNGESLTYAQQGGVKLDEYYWNGSLELATDAPAAAAGNQGVLAYYNVAPGTRPTQRPAVQQGCPTTAYQCTIYAATDGRDVVEELNVANQVVSYLDPAGVSYNLAYSASGNLTSLTQYANTSSPSTWNYLYDTAASPYSSDLVEIYDPDAVVSSPVSLSSGAAHSTTVTYGTGTEVGMASSLTDGTGVTTTYAYQDSCATGQCFAPNAPQQTTVTYPAQEPCPSCAAASPVEVDSYSGGVATSTSLGSPSNPYLNETWNYAWTLGYGATNSTETISYPDSLSGVSAHATLTLDPYGNVVSTTNALGDVATSAYNDAGANNLPELLWSYPGSSPNGPTNPPPGSEVYTYNFVGQVTSATNPLGEVTGYCYQSGALLTYLTPPSVSDAGCGTGSPPAGAVVYTYDTQGDVTATTTDYQDTTPGADPQTTSAGYDVMGNTLWTIPAPGQSGPQGPTNPYATVYTYTPAGQVASETPPGQTTTTNGYDAAGNLVITGNKGDSSNWDFVTTLYDGDNRPCYQLQAYGIWPGSCTSPSQAGATITTYVPGSNNPATVTNGNNLTTTYYYADLAYPNAPTVIVNPGGTATQYRAYDDLGNVCLSGDVAPTLGVATQCATLPGDTSSTYDALGNETSVTDPSGNVTTNAFGDAAYPNLETSSTNALGATTTNAYDAAGQLVMTTNPDGSTVETSYDVDGRVSEVAACGPNEANCGPGYPPQLSGDQVTTYSYNGAFERTGTVTKTPTTQASTTSSYSSGQLMSTTDANAKTLTYLYNYAGQLACIGYPVSATTNCGSVSAPATGSATNTIVTRGYDALGRLSTVSDWLNNTTTYDYDCYWTPYSPSSITYPSSTGLSSQLGVNNAGQTSSLSTGSAVNDSWSYDGSGRVATTTINGTTSNYVGYNANNQIVSATNMATSTNNDHYTIAPNGAITSDTTPTGAVTTYSYNAGAQLCNQSAAAGQTPCGVNPTNGTSFTYTPNGERSSATPYTNAAPGPSTSYAWNALGELCNVASSATPCGEVPTSGASYQYNADGLRTLAQVPGLPPEGSVTPVNPLQSSGGTGDASVAFNAQTTGDAVVLSVNVGSPSTTVTAVSGGNASWQKITSTLDGLDVELWLGTIYATGFSPINVQFSGNVSSTQVELSAQEYASSLGTATRWRVDASGNTHNDTPSTSVAFPSLTASTTQDLYVGYAQVPNGGSPGATPGVTYDQTVNNNLFVYSPGVSSTLAPVGTQVTAGTSVTVAALLVASGPAPITSTASTFDSVAGGSIPLNVNDATSLSGGPTTNVSYLYGDLLYGGTAPIEQITTSPSGVSTAVFLVTNPTGVQGVFSQSGATLEEALYSTYGVESITAGSNVTPFGFQGSYRDATGLIYLINRYYDPATDQFLSVDPMVATTNQPYVFTNDNPLNATDPLGLKGWYCRGGVSHYYAGNRYGRVGGGKCAQQKFLALAAQHARVFDLTSPPGATFKHSSGHSDSTIQSVGLDAIIGGSLIAGAAGPVLNTGEGLNMFFGTAATGAVTETAAASAAIVGETVAGVATVTSVGIGLAVAGPVIVVFGLGFVLWSAR